MKGIILQKRKESTEIHKHIQTNTTTKKSSLKVNLNYKVASKTYKPTVMLIINDTESIIQFNSSDLISCFDIFMN